jgi:hypothetical protein
MSARYHVVPSAKGRWTVKRSDASRPTESFDRKTDAVEAARKFAHRVGGQLVIHGRDGRIMESDTYPQGFGSLKNKYVLRKGIDFTKPLYEQTKKSTTRSR